MGTEDSRFHAIIRQEAARQGLSGYALGKLSGVPMRTVQGYLAGENDITAIRLEKIAEALGLALRPKTKAKRAKKKAR